MQRLIPLAFVTVAITTGWTFAVIGADDDKPKYTISDVMKKGHTPKGLLKKVIAGNATKEEKETLIEMYVALGKNKPPKGEEESWKEKSDALLKAAKDDDVAALKTASDCSACHKVHKK